LGSVATRRQAGKRLAGEAMAEELSEEEQQRRLQKILNQKKKTVRALSGCHRQTAE